MHSTKWEANIAVVCENYKYPASMGGRVFIDKITHVRARLPLFPLKVFD
jgi:hypothetical protein